MSEQFDGGCLCGAVRFRAVGKPNWVLWCHCQSCRRNSGGPASVFVAFEHEAVTVTKGQIAKYTSPAGTRRGFCSWCGSTLSCESEQRPTETHLRIGAFDQASELKPTGHIFPEERLPWLHLSDE